jgi:hypothetical protein
MRRRSPAWGERRKQRSARCSGWRSRLRSSSHPAGPPPDPPLTAADSDRLRRLALPTVAVSQSDCSSINIDQSRPEPYADLAEPPLVGPDDELPTTCSPAEPGVDGDSQQAEPGAPPEQVPADQPLGQHRCPLTRWTGRLGGWQPTPWRSGTRSCGRRRPAPVRRAGPGDFGSWRWTWVTDGSSL